MLAHRDLVNRLVWSPDSSQLLSADQQTSYVWDVARRTRRKLHEFKTDENVGYDNFAWSQPDHIDVAWSWGSSYFHRIDVATGKVEKLFDLVDANLHDARATYSPDGRSMAVVVGQQVHVLEAKTGKVLNKIPVPSDRLFLAWSPDGQRLAFGGYWGTLEVWESRGKKPLQQLGKPFDSPHVIGLLWSNDGRDVIAYGHHGLLAWNIETGEERSYPSDHTAIHHYCISTTGTYVAAAISGDLTVYSGEGRRLWSQTNHHPSADEPQWSPDGKHLAYWSAAHGESEAFIVVASASDGSVLSRRKHLGDYDYRWTADGHELAIARQGGKVEFVDPLSEQTLRTLATGHEEAYLIRFSSNGKQLATGDGKRTVKLWTLGKDKPDHVLEGHQGGVHLAWSPDGNLLAVAGTAEYEIAIYNGSSGELLQKCSHPMMHQTSRIVWSPNSQLLLAHGSHAGDSAVFDVATGDVVRRIDGRPGGVGYVWPEQNRMAFFRHSYYVRWWDWDAGRFEAPLPSYNLNGTAQPVAPDGRTIASMQPSGALFVWDFSQGERHGTLVPLANRHQVTLDASGHYRLSHPFVASDLRIVAEIGGSQSLFTLAAFAKRFGWSNDPASVRLSPKWAEQPRPEGQP